MQGPSRCRIDHAAQVKMTHLCSYEAAWARAAASSDSRWASTSSLAASAALKRATAAWSVLGLACEDKTSN